MDTISQLKKDIERYDADALYYVGRAEHCRHEATLLRQELAIVRNGYSEKQGARRMRNAARDRDT
jgi:hypothetical protein